MTIRAEFPNAIFEVSTGEREGFPAVAVFNTALAAYEGCREFPWLVELEIRAEHTADRGMPTLEEVDVLNAIEQRLRMTLSPLGAHFVARQTWKGRRMLDFYVADGPSACERVNALAAQGEFARMVTVRTSQDDSWATWMPTLIRMCQPSTVSAAGSAELEQSVLVRIPLSGGEFGSDEEQNAVLELADALSEIVTEANAGEFDGFEFGNAEATLFAYGADADLLFASLEPTLRSATVARGAVVTKYYGRSDDDTTDKVTVTI